MNLNKQFFRDFVNSVVIVSVFREIADSIEINYDSVLVLYGMNLGVFDSLE